MARIAGALFWSQTPDDLPRDITGPEIVPGIEGAGGGPWFWVFGILAVALISAGATFWLMCRRRGERRVIESAPARSLRQLDRLERLQLLTNGHSERHFTFLAGILRRFVARRHGVAAPRQTTDEFLDAVATHEELTKETEFLKRFLTECDIAKFAPPAASNGHGDRLAAELRDWLARQKATIPSRRLDAPLPPPKMSDS